MKINSGRILTCSLLLILVFHEAYASGSTRKEKIIQTRDGMLLLDSSSEWTLFEESTSFLDHFPFPRQNLENNLSLSLMPNSSHGNYYRYHLLYDNRNSQIDRWTRLNLDISYDGQNCDAYPIIELLRNDKKDRYVLSIDPVQEIKSDRDCNPEKHSCEIMLLLGKETPGYVVISLPLKIDSIHEDETYLSSCTFTIVGKKSFKIDLHRDSYYPSPIEHLSLVWSRGKGQTNEIYFWATLPHESNWKGWHLSTFTNTAVQIFEDNTGNSIEAIEAIHSNLKPEEEMVLGLEIVSRNENFLCLNHFPVLYLRLPHSTQSVVVQNSQIQKLSKYHHRFTYKFNFSSLLRHYPVESLTLGLNPYQAGSCQFSIIKGDIFLSTSNARYTTSMPSS